MRPIKLTFSGLRSYRAETTIDFSGLDLFAVIGDTGAGKSTIIEALCLALYAKKSWSGGAKLEQLITDGEKLMRIELTFAAAGDVWVVTRVRRRSGAGVIDKLVSTTGGLGADGASSVTERVGEIIGLNYDQFTRAVVLPQGRFDSMLQAGEKERNAILTSILDLDDIVATRTEVERLRSHWSPKLSAWQADRAHYPPDPVTALGVIAEQAAVAEQRASALEAVVQRADQLLADAGAVDAARQPLRAALDAEVDVEPAVIDSLGARHARWAELVAAGVAAERAAREATDALQALDEKTTDILAGFERRDDLITARHTIERAVDELPAILERVEDRRARVQTLEAAPPSAAVAPEVVADAAAKHEARRAAREVLDASERTVDQARQLWERWAASVRALADVKAQVVAKQGMVELAGTEAESARSAAHGAEEAVARARSTLHATMVADAAATAAAECVPGDGCPVCTRPLPDDFVVPAPSADRATAEAALARAEAKLKRKQTDEQKASADLAGHASDLQRLQADEADVATASVEARRASTKAGVNVEATGVDAGIAALVAARDAVATDAARAEEVAATAAAAVARGEAAAEAALQAYAKELEAARDALVVDERTLTALAAAIDVLPRAWTDLEADDLLGRATKAGHALREAVAALDAIEVERADRSSAREAAQQQVGELAAQIRDEARDPAAEAIRRVNTGLASARNISRATEQAASIVGGPLDTPDADALVDVAAATTPEELAARIDAVAAAVAGARSVHADGVGVLAAADARAKTTASAVTALLAEAHGATVDELRIEWGTAREQHRSSVAAVAVAELAATRATTIDEILSVARPFAANLEALAVALRDQHFIAHLVDARETELLAEASRRLKAITKGRFGFVADFGVVSIASGEVRSADTLSGGERFQAALALALALVEIASRGGGRLDAVFIDEGFGSLDSNALDVALDTLGLVSGDGKMVALISHLRPVAEYVDTVLHVTKDDTLGSRISLLDAESRDQMLADDTRGGLTA